MIMFGNTPIAVAILAGVVDAISVICIDTDDSIIAHGPSDYSDSVSILLDVSDIRSRIDR